MLPKNGVFGNYPGAVPHLQLPKTRHYRYFERASEEPLNNQLLWIRSTQDLLPQVHISARDAPAHPICRGLPALTQGVFLRQDFLKSKGGKIAMTYAKDRYDCG